MSVTLITGGARSGKSAHAEQRAHAYERVTYIATARAMDEEMKARIARHRQSRPESWTTFEGVHHLSSAIAPGTQCALLDCITNLITNLMMDMDVDWEHPQEQDVQKAEETALCELTELITRANALNCTLIMVNNEVGMGLVPVYPFARAFRDIAGRVAQKLALMSDEVILMVAGLALQVK